MSGRPTPKSKREILKRAVSEAEIMRIIDQAYDNADNCENCRALSEWWEKFGSELPRPGVGLSGRKGR